MAPSPNPIIQVSATYDYVGLKPMILKAFNTPELAIGSIVGLDGDRFEVFDVTGDDVGLVVRQTGLDSKPITFITTRITLRSTVVSCLNPETLKAVPGSYDRTIKGIKVFGKFWPFGLLRTAYMRADGPSSFEIAVDMFRQMMDRRITPTTTIYN